LQENLQIFLFFIEKILFEKDNHLLFLGIHRFFHISFIESVYNHHLLCYNTKLEYYF